MGFSITVIGRAEYRNAECRVLFMIMLNVIIPSAVMLIVLAPVDAVIK